MSLEVERKFLVKDPPKDLGRFAHEQVKQGYMVIGDDGSEARLRERGDDHTVTVKSKGTKSRGEWEVRLTRSQFDELWPSTEGRRVEKERYVIPLADEDGPYAELDVYAGSLAGLMTVEVEFNDEDLADAFVAPDWFGADVTEIPAYKNQQLATAGRPSIG